MAFIPLEVFANNPSTTVSSGGTTAPAAGTAETWTVASSASFPAVVEIGATQFHVADPAPGSQSEIIAVINVSGTTWTVTRGAESTTPVAHASGFTVVQVVTAGALASIQYEPWQFPVERYGAQGDGKIGTGGTGSSGSATFTDAGASFVNAAAPLGDVGKYIIVNQGTSGAGTGAGTLQSPFVGTILAVNSPTSVTLSGNLAAPAASAPYIYGTDDVAAINAAVTAATSWATSTGNYRVQVMFQPGNYMLGSGPTQTTSPNGFNTQIPLPPGSSFARKLVIDLVGVGGTAEPFYWESTVPGLQGTCLVSAQWVTGQPDATFGLQSVIGGPTSTTGLTGGFANTLVNISGIMVVCPWNSQQAGFDFTLMSQANFMDGSYVAFAPVNLSGLAIGGPYLNAYPADIVANGQSVGVIFPKNLNNDFSSCGLITVEGASTGVRIAEHFNAGKMTVAYCNIGVQVNTSGGAAHGATIEHLSAEVCNYIIDTTFVAGGPFPIWVGLSDSENIATAHINDPSNCLTGWINWADITSTRPVVTGGTGLIVYDLLKHVPGPWAGAPAAPASGVAQQNTAYRPALIKVTSTAAISATATGPASGSLTTTTETVAIGAAAVLMVPPGHWYSVTSAGGTLTAKWTLG